MYNRKNVANTTSDSRSATSMPNYRVSGKGQGGGGFGEPTPIDCLRALVSLP
jgi:hypothetical protein